MNQINVLREAMRFMRAAVRSRDANNSQMAMAPQSLRVYRNSLG